MKHSAKSMEASTSTQEDVWYVDSRSSNHMMNHEEWFTTLKPEQSGYVEIGNDTSIPLSISKMFV